MSGVGTRTNRGFTLVELMITLFVVGLVSAAVVWTLPAPSTDARAEAERLAQLFRRTADESLLTGNIIGIVVQPDQYSVYMFRRGAWLPMSGSKIFAAHQLSDAVSLDLIREGSDLFQRDGGDDFGSLFIRPNIVFYPSGLSPVFAVSVRSESATYRVTADTAGDIRMASADAG